MQKVHSKATSSKEASQCKAQQSKVNQSETEQHKTMQGKTLLNDANECEEKQRIKATLIILNLRIYDFQLFNQPIICHLINLIS